MRLSWRGLVRWPRIFHFRILSPQAWLYQEELGASGSANGHIKIQPWGPRLKRSVSTLPASRVNLTYHGEEREVRPWPTSNQDSNHEEWEAVLADAFIHGIRTKDQLCFEADVGHQSDIGSRLIDKLPGRQNIELWHILIRAQALMNGHEGIKAIWRATMHRGKAVRFDDKDPRVNALWFTFLSAGSNDQPFLSKLCKRAIGHKFDRPALFAEVIGTSLEGDQPDKAAKIASWLLEPQVRIYRGREDLLSAFSAACLSNAPTAMRAFCNVYDLLPNAHIYSEVTSGLWQHNRASDAFMMHSYLISRRDLPAKFEDLLPFVNHLAADDRQVNSFLAPMNAAGASFDAQAHRAWSRERSRVRGFSAESLNVVASNTLGVAPKKLSDEFVARGFATRSFSFDFAVNSLRIIGLIEVGPLAVRQMVITAPDNATLQARFNRLAELGIDTGSSVFVQVIKKLCHAGHWDMVQALVDSDMHHEVFEDAELQERLLTEYCRTGDWKQINRTLTILCKGELDQQARLRSATMVIKAMLLLGNWPAAVNIARSLQGRGSESITTALPLAITSILRLTRVTELTRAERIDQTALLIGMLQHLLASGVHFPIKYWRGPLRALGQSGRMKELESLVYWIAETYRATGLYEQVHHTRLSYGESNLNALFNETFQKALMTWCFKTRRGMRAVSPEQCLRWTRILKRLRDTYGIQIREHFIRWTFIRGLRWIFGVGMYTKPEGWMRRYKVISLKRYWNMYDSMWDMRPSRIIDAYDRVAVVLRGGKRRTRPHGKRQRLLPFTDAGRAPTPHESMPEDIVMYRDMFHPSWEDYRK
ncbi:hypothetical protein PV05_11494 [Exophiala xenobiotica]|uniref:Pentatricopeptide repeat domain-containing protein n=1 Tax=Exophiala xenobiotica TaxID=348802 RepID=A0A0D2BCJ6_9EURO|nr:uncharacterized protein PV05_11494 [Exophiala xenobiotica]KIW49851.1 hypothetical protein PV05_11494 [Exophiala xenobiotica]